MNTMEAVLVRRGSARLLQALQACCVRRGSAPSPRITVRGLIEHAAQLAGVDSEMIYGRRQLRWVVDLRRAIVLVAKEHTELSYPAMGSVMGGRDHSTMINLKHTGEDKRARDPEFAAFVERLWAAAECEPFGPRAWVPEPLAPEPETPLLDQEPELPGDHEAEIAEIDVRTACSSRLLIQAIRREFPERVVACVDYVRAPRQETIRLGYSMAVAD